MTYFSNINCQKHFGYKASTSYTEFKCRCENCKYWHKSYRHKYDVINRDVCNLSRRKWAKENPQRMKNIKNNWNEQNKQSVKNTQLKIKFGITLEEYKQLLKKQDTQCAICGVYQEDCSKAFAVDHNHNTDQIRGLLCHACNIGLGHFKDNILILESAVAYLKEWKELLQGL